MAQSRANTERVYDWLSRFYDRLAGGEERRLVVEGLALLDATTGERVLEVGCGTGRALADLSQSVGLSGACVGLDLSKGMLRVAGKRVSAARSAATAHLVRGDALSLPLAEAFDAEFFSFALELFETPQMIAVLRECRRVLRPGGRLVVVSLSAAGRSTLARELYVWAHRMLPSLVDCRPIHVVEALAEAGFAVLKSTDRVMWGLPVTIALARHDGPLRQEGRDAD